MRYKAEDQGMGRAHVRNHALDVMRQALVSGELRPGDIYSAAALAKRLGVSNSPVRDAVLTLVHEGLMEPVPNRGFRVVPLSEHDLDEVCELRLMLEVPALCRLAERDISGHREALTEMAQAIEAAAEAADVIRFLDSDREFHLALLELLGNRRLVTTVANLRDQTRLYGLEVLATEGKLMESALEHRALLDAILNHDRDAVEHLSHAHITHTRHEWADQGRV